MKIFWKTIRIIIKYRLTLPSCCLEVSKDEQTLIVLLKSSKMIKCKITCICFFLVVSSAAVAQQTITSSESSKLTPFIEALEQFSENIPHEKVYLHLDNTSYYQGDNIWFKAYIVTSGRNEPSLFSKTLYVELLNPGGEIVDKRILKVENGQCHGEFTLIHQPFYSGFYEIRAYTKYMLNFGEDCIFSRLLPVFDNPKTPGNFEEKEMLKYGRYGPGNKYPMKRKSPVREKAVNLRFFPEGGNLVQGVASRVAFEATDEAGNPIDVTGVVMNADKQESGSITTLHEGKGIFTYTPSGGRRKDLAEVEYSGKKYRFDLPVCLPQGVTMEIDNLSYPDSIEIILRKKSDTPAEMLGLAILSGGEFQNAFYINTKYDETKFRTDKTGLPSGVSQILLFNNRGDILCDRLVFISNDDDFLEIKATTDKKSYKPFELVEIEFSITDRETNPVNTAFSLSIRDASNEVAGSHSVLTDLLLMSEIKGYVRNPSYYFESDDETNRAALDVLLMVQGWRRYAWKQMAGIEPFELKYFVEEGIEINGNVVSLVRKIPKPNVNVTLFLNQRGEEDEEKYVGFVESSVTDSLGRFSFVANVDGKWNMMLSVTEEGKRKDHRILLDRLFSPDPRRYRYAEMQVDIAEEDGEDLFAEENRYADNLDSLFVSYTDFLSKSGINEKIKILPEVTVTAKRNSREAEIRNARSTASAYYDMASELDDIFDRGEYIGDDIYEVLMKMDKNFSMKKPNIEFDFTTGTLKNPDDESLFRYKGKSVKIVIDYDPYYRPIKSNEIKSIYINEIPSVANKYNYIKTIYYSNGKKQDVYMKFGCIVFIETFPDGRTPAESVKGVRKTWLDGYSEVKEFYSPDYTILPPEPDYRRTLYWNPSVITDENGSVNINFYNNSSCRYFSISAETVTSQGMIGILKTNK